VRVLLYTGKGGVGKTTTAAATAVWAAAQGLRTLVASADAAHSLGDVLEMPLGPEPSIVDDGRSSPASNDEARGESGAGHGLPSGTLHAVEIDARAEISRHWGAVRDYLVRIFRYQGIEEVMADELALLPGLEELTTLLAVDTWAGQGHYDLIVVDCAPTDSALRLLTLPDAAHGALRILLRLQRAITGVMTPLARNLVAAPLPDAAVFRDAEDLIYRQLRRLRDRVASPDTSVRLVVTPEQMVIDEALRARTDLALFEVACDAVVMNRLLPAEAAAEPFFAEWVRRQVEYRREVETLFAPLPLLTAPLQDDEITGLGRLRAQGRTLFEGRRPEAFLCREPGLRFQATAGGVQMRLPLPGAEPQDLDVAKLAGELVVRTPGLRRPIPLPRHLAGMDLAAARWRDGTLCVEFLPRAAPEPQEAL
jgi:arsenite-transporting ATPase